ncbi:MAG: ComF family protein [Bythopirellula sp.]|nr:ComF family protein [Bythopirellula sp.]
MLARAAQIWKSVRNRSLDLLFTQECLACLTELPADHVGVPICDACLAEIPPVDWPVCRRCAAKVPEYPGYVATCPRCDENRLRFDATYSLGHYEGLLRDLVLRMKTDRREQLAQVFARLICERYGESLRQLEADAIMPIPMTPWHRLRRKTNPQEVIAAGVGRELGIPVFRRLLKRSHNLHPQRGLSSAGRLRNVRGGYHVRGGYQMQSPHVLLVDDVLTTGATCSEVARILKRSGAARVTVLVVARTPNS